MTGTFDPFAEVPSGWTRRRLKTLCAMRSGAGIHRDEISAAGPYPVYGGNGVRGHTSAYTHDGVFPLVGRQGARCGNVHLVRGKFWASEHAVVASPSQGVDARWLARLLKVMNLGQHSQAAAQPGLAVERVRLLPAVLPPLDEQLAIARVLDHLELRIAGAIASKRKLTELLDEALASTAWQLLVGTNGVEALQPHPWMGDVPADWRIMRLKTLLQEHDDRSTTGSEPLLSLRMRQGLVPAAAYSKKPVHPEHLIGYKKVDRGTLVMNRMRASIGLFGIAEGRGLVSPDYATFTARPGAPLYLPYLLLLLKTRQAGSEIRKRSKGLGTGSSGFLRIYSDAFGAMPIAVPGPIEQRSRADAVLEATRDLNAAIAATLRETELLQEYRTRLIADVVTGRRDVRAEAAALPDVDPDELDAVLSAASADDDVDEDDQE